MFHPSRRGLPGRSFLGGDNASQPALSYLVRPDSATVTKGAEDARSQLHLAAHRHLLESQDQSECDCEPAARVCQAAQHGTAIVMSWTLPGKSAL